MSRVVCVSVLDFHDFVCLLNVLQSHIGYVSISVKFALVCMKLWSFVL